MAGAKEGKTMGVPDAEAEATSLIGMAEGAVVVGVGAVANKTSTQRTETPIIMTKRPADKKAI